MSAFYHEHLLYGSTFLTTHKKPPQKRRFLNGGEGGIRTLGTVRYTHFPGVLFRPLRHLSKLKGALYTRGLKKATITPLTATPFTSTPLTPQQKPLQRQPSQKKPHQKSHLHTATSRTLQWQHIALHLNVIHLLIKTRL